MTRDSVPIERSANLPYPELRRGGKIPSFDPSISFSWTADSPEDPRGFYVVYGNAEDAQIVLGRLQSFGLETRAGEIWGFDFLAANLATPEFLIVVLGLLLMMGILGFWLSLEQARAYAVQRMFGRPVSAIVARDFRRTGRALLLTAGVVTGSWLVVLAFYNRWAFLDLFAVVALACVGLLVAASTAGRMVGAVLVSRVRLVRALKGELLTWQALTIAYLARALISGLVVAFGLTLNSQLGAAIADVQAAPYWSRSADSAAILMSGSFGGRDSARLDALAPDLEHAEANGELIVVDISLVGTGAGQFQTIMVVNGAYLDQQRVRLADGTTLSSADVLPDTGLALIPRGEHPPPKVEELCSAQLAGLSGPEGRPLACQTEVLAAGQRFFTYGTQHEADQDLVSPSLVVVLPRARVISSYNLVSFATSGQVFKDAATARRLAANSQWREVVIGVQTMSIKHAYNTKVRAQRIATGASALALALVGALVAVQAIGVVYARGHAQRIFACYLQGASFWRTHSWLLAVEAGVALALIVNGVEQARGAHRSFGSGPLNPSEGANLWLVGWEPCLALALVMLTVASLLVTIVRTSELTVKKRCTSL